MMKRDIRFRAVRDDMSNVGWVYGNLVLQETKTRIYLFGIQRLHVTCIPNTECEFVNKQDITGKDIYENDLVSFKVRDGRSEKEQIGQVVWSHKKCGFVIVYKQYQSADIFDQKHVEIGECTIVGDTFFNPEMKIV